VHHHLFPGANTALPWLLARDPRYAAHRDGLANAVQAHADFLRGADPYGLGPKLRIDLFGLKAGGTTAGRLIAPLRPHLPELQPGGAYLVEVVIRNLAVGHPFTQGTADSNEVWVECTARSAGRVIGQSGALDEGRVDEWAHFVNVLMLDRHGQRIDRRNPQDIFTPLYDHQVPAGAAQVVHYRLEVPPDLREPVEMHVRLRYRKFDPTYLEKIYGPDRVPPLPVVDLCEDRVTLPVTGGGRVPEQSSPIVPAWQRWNDYGIGCLLEGGPDAKKGELRQAEEVFRYLTAGADREAHGPAYLNLARVYQAEGRLGEAADALNRARTADPPAPWWTVAWLTGLVNAQNGHLEEAVAAFEQVLDPARQPRDRRFDFTQDYQVINELGKTLFALAQQEGQPAARDRWLRRAVEAFERTLAIDPEDVDAHYGLAQCYSRLGEAAPALAGDQGALVAEDQPLAAAGAVLANERAPRGERLVAAFQLSRALAEFGRRPPDPRHPQLPALQKLREDCLTVYRSPNDPGLFAAAALVLGELHRLAHAIYKPDDTARGQVMAIYRKAHPAAAAASESIVIYRLKESDKPGSGQRSPDE
jgi:tetratricopeptide (TPR) repeat protein